MTTQSYIHIFDGLHNVNSKILIFEFRIFLKKISDLSSYLQTEASLLYYTAQWTTNFNFYRLPESIRSIINETTQLHACTDTLAFTMKNLKMIPSENFSQTKNSFKIIEIELNFNQCWTKGLYTRSPELDMC